MMVDGLPDYQIDNGNFDYAAIAHAAGIHSVRIERPGEVRDGLSGALAHPGPALIDLVTDPNALSIPPHITGAQGVRLFWSEVERPWLRAIRGYEGGVRPRIGRSGAPR
jgi:thiamine pyrophosphate-dependent acetolactate synthase large subunit-like protein